MIYVIRHGQTELNNVKALQGRSNLPLNDIGISQAEETAAKLRNIGVSFDQVYSSPLDRACKTARIISPGKEPEIDERLIEMEYGPYEGVKLSELPEEVMFFFKDFVNHPVPEGMEPLSDVVARTGEFIEELKDVEGNVLISTHAIAMKGILEYLTPGSNGSYWSKYIGNCEVYSFELKNGQFTVPVSVRL